MAISRKFLKYLSATLVIIYDMTHPERRASPWFIPSFLVTLLYQIWWDTSMDWDLFRIARREDIPVKAAKPDGWCAPISSFQRPGE
jgi:hypothetical protein